MAVLNSFLKEDKLAVERMERGFAWLDTGTHSSLLDAGNFVKTLTERQGLQMGSPEEVAFRRGFIDEGQLVEQAEKYNKNSYGVYLKNLNLQPE